MIVITTEPKIICHFIKCFRVAYVKYDAYIDFTVTRPLYSMSLVVRKPVFGVSEQVPHKPGCTATEDVKRPEISDLGSRGIVLSV